MNTEFKMLMPMGIEATELFRVMERVSNVWRGDMDFSRSMDRLFTTRRAMAPGQSPYPPNQLSGNHVNVIA